MTKTATKGRLGVAGSLLIGLVVACCLLTGGLAVLADPIATSVARDQLAQRGVECDERLAVALGWTLRSARIDPTSCTLSEGDVAGFELLDPVTVELNGLDPTRVTGGRARVISRIEPPVVSASGLGGVLGVGAMLDTVAIPQRVGMVVAASARLSATELPAVELGSVEVVHGERVGIVLTGVHLVGRHGTTPLALRVDRAELPVIEGPMGLRAAITIAPLTTEATPQQATLQGQLRVDAQLPIVGGIQHEVPITVTAEGLDGPSPRYDLQM